jgi:prepilin-type processing-associated H-X9-DG protein
VDSAQGRRRKDCAPAKPLIKYNCTNDAEVYSFHPGGANAAFADGSVKFLKESLDIRIFARLVTRAGGEVVSAGDY